MLQGISSTFLEFIAPMSCIHCRASSVTPRAPLCPDCLGQVAWWRSLDGCPRCGFRRRAENRRRSSSAIGVDAAGIDLESLRFETNITTPCPGCYSQGSALHRCHSLVRYEGQARQWIPRFKHRSTLFGPPLESRIAIEFLAEELARRLAARGADRPDWIVPVALHPRRRRQRGFNHSDVIARRIAQFLDLPLETSALVRLRDTAPQAMLSIEERRANLRRAFHVTRSMHALGRVWLVDDVLTTGSTLEAAAEACLDAGAGEVHALTLAATSPRSHPM